MTGSMYIKRISEEISKEGRGAKLMGSDPIKRR